MKKNMWLKRKKSHSHYTSDVGVTLPFSPFSQEGRDQNAIFLGRCEECDSEIYHCLDEDPNQLGPALYRCINPECNWQAFKESKGE